MRVVGVESCAWIRGTLNRQNPQDLVHMGGWGGPQNSCLEIQKGDGTISEMWNRRAGPRLEEDELDLGRVEFESLILHGASPLGHLKSSWNFTVPTRILELLFPTPPQTCPCPFVTISENGHTVLLR